MIPANPDLNDVRVFVRVVETRSFAEAGRSLSMPRSTVSRHISQLERSLGVRLMQRTTRKLTLTEEGSEYYERCARAMAALAEAENLVKQAQLTPRGRVRLTAPHDLSHHLAPLVASFLSKHPEVQIAVELSQRMVDLVGEGFDLALRASAALPDSSLVARRVGGGEAGLYASKTYLDRRGTPKRPEELRQHACIALGLHKQHASWRLERKGEALEVPIEPSLQVNDPSFAQACAVAGLGVAFLPTGLEDARAPGLVRVLPEWSLPQGGALYVVVPSAKHLTAAVRALREHLVVGLTGVFGAAPGKPAGKPATAKLPKSKRKAFSRR